MQRARIYRGHNDEHEGLKMNIKQIIPPWHSVAREGLIVLGGILIAAYIISRFPRLKSFVSDNSVTLKDDGGNIII